MTKRQTKKSKNFSSNSKNCFEEAYWDGNTEQSILNRSRPMPCDLNSQLRANYSPI